MGLLHEPDKAEASFVLTPDYDTLMAEFAAANPEYPSPHFTPAEKVMCAVLHWPAEH
jgi:hypothetical protein